MTYPWYETIYSSDELLQGDLITDCPIITPPIEPIPNSTYKLTVSLFNCIVLSQSCDLVGKKIQIVLVSPYISLPQFLQGLPTEQQGTKASQKIIESLKKGHLPNFHIINKYPQEEVRECSVVDFRLVYGIDMNVLETHAGRQTSRKRLLSPYREHLSQSFARYFMRVGLPTSIDA